jgi:hypothetical protein
MRQLVPGPDGKRIRSSDSSRSANFSERFTPHYQIIDVSKAALEAQFEGFGPVPNGPQGNFDGGSVPIADSYHGAEFGPHKPTRTVDAAPKELDFQDFDALSPLFLAYKFIILNYNFSTASP